MSDWHGHYDSSGLFPIESSETEVTTVESVKHEENLSNQQRQECDNCRFDTSEAVPYSPSSILTESSSKSREIPAYLVTSLTNGKTIESHEESSRESLPSESLFSESVSPSSTSFSSLDGSQTNVLNMDDSFVTPAVSTTTRTTLQDRMRVMQQRLDMHKQHEGEGILVSPEVVVESTRTFETVEAEAQNDRQLESVHFNNTIPVVYDKEAQERAKSDYLSHSPLAKHNAFDSTIHSYSYLYGPGPDQSDGKLHAFEQTHEYHFPTQDIGKAINSDGSDMKPYLETRYVASSSQSTLVPSVPEKTRQRMTADPRQLRHRYQRKSPLSPLTSYTFPSSLNYPSTVHHRRSLHYDEYNRPQYRVYLAPNDYHFSGTARHVRLHGGQKQIPVDLPRSRARVQSYPFPPPTDFIKSPSEDSRYPDYSSDDEVSVKPSHKNPIEPAHKPNIATVNIYNYRGDELEAHPSHNFEFDLKTTPKGQGVIDLCVGSECSEFQKTKDSLPNYVISRRPHPTSNQESSLTVKDPPAIMYETKQRFSSEIPKYSTYEPAFVDVKPMYRSSDETSSSSLFRPRNHPWYTSPYD